MNLFQHQQDALTISEGLSHVAYYHDMGLGKTFTGAEKMMQLNAKINLIICQKSKVNDWLNHFVTYYFDDLSYVYDLSIKKELDQFIQKCTEKGYQNDIKVGVINYDLVWRRSELVKLTGFTLMLDESSLIQNKTAKRTKCIMKMHPTNVILLSGSPCNGKYEQLWTQMQLLGWNISEDLFFKQFCITDFQDIGGKMIPTVVGYKNVDRLKRKMREHGCQFLSTADVFDLPEQVFQTIHVPQSKQYRQFRKDRIVDVDNDTLVGDTTLTKLLYERELCGGYSAEKLTAFEDLLTSTSDRFVVFYNFNIELDRLTETAERCGRKFGVVNGQVKQQEMIAEDGVVLFVQYQAGAMGINLQTCNRIIYYTLPLSSDLYEQSKKRIHRIGQEKTCFYYLLIVTGSVEERIKATLEKRLDYTVELFEEEEC